MIMLLYGMQYRQTGYYTGTAETRANGDNRAPKGYPELPGEAMTAVKPEIEIFADGACSGNPGPGGYGAILRHKGKEKELSGYEPLTTNNRMELLGVINAIESLRKPCRVTVTTDSNYVVKGMNEWIQGWIKNGWRNSQKKEVLNRDLWERLLRAAGQHNVAWKWIRGHNGHPENERCDRLARREIEKNGKVSELPPIYR